MVRTPFLGLLTWISPVGSHRPSILAVWMARESCEVACFGIVCKREDKDSERLDHGESVS